MVIYGRHPVKESLKATVIPKVVYVANGTKLDTDLQRYLIEAKVDIRTVSRKQLDQLSNSQNHQGIAADIGELTLSSLNSMLKQTLANDGVILGLDRWQDPRNVGSLIRTAELLGASGVILSSAKGVSITPTVVKASAGACFHIPIAIGNLLQFAKRWEKEGGFVTVLSMDGDDIRNARSLRPLLLIIGAEGKGVSASLKAIAHEIWSIPMFGKVSSFNASVAGAIALWEISRHR